MLFNSYSFIFLFLPTVFCGAFWLGRFSHRLAALWLGIASLAFYAIWDARFVLLLLVSIAFNYGAGYWIGLCRSANDDKRVKYSLILAITSNLSLLGYFKYANFFLDSLNRIVGSQIPAMEIILPLGISFFTFTQIAYLIDVSRGITREFNFIHYLLFVTYFPHLIAGPVLHHKQMMPQFAKPSTYRLNAENVAVGLTIFILGLSKKVLIADNLAGCATPVFQAAQNGQVLSFSEAWSGALAYTLQLYFDFSGYSDMAVGLSLMFNVRLPLNFDSPYKALSIIDFWRRWHMTLSAFLRDYLYFALGGNRKGVLRRYINLMATMLLGGLWHGAGWTFIVWGGLHGLFLVANHGWRELKSKMNWGDGGRFADLIAGTLTFIAIVVAWVFFRADSIAAASSMLGSMAGLNGLLTKWTPVRETLKFVIPCLLAVWLLPNVREMLIRFRPTWDDVSPAATVAVLPQQSRLNKSLWNLTAGHALLAGALFLLCIMNLSKASEFLYFQF